MYTRFLPALSSMRTVPRRSISYLSQGAQDAMDHAARQSSEVSALKSSIEGFEHQNPTHPELMVEIGSKNRYDPAQHRLSVTGSGQHPVSTMAHETRHVFDKLTGVIKSDTPDSSWIQTEVNAVASQRKATIDAHEPPHPILSMTEAELKRSYTRAYELGDVPKTTPGKSLT